MRRSGDPVSKYGPNVPSCYNSIQNDNTTTPTTASNNDVLIMEDDEIERQRQQIDQYSTDNDDAERYATAAQEEELLRLALELSVSDTNERNISSLHDISLSESSTRTNTYPSSSITTTTTNVPIPAPETTRPRSNHMIGTGGLTRHSFSSVQPAPLLSSSAHSYQRQQQLQQQPLDYPNNTISSTTISTSTNTSLRQTHQQHSHIAQPLPVQLSMESLMISQRQSMIKQQPKSLSSHSLDNNTYSNNKNHYSTTTSTVDHQDVAKQRIMVQRSLSDTSSTSSQTPQQQVQRYRSDDLLLGANKDNDFDDDDDDYFGNDHDDDDDDVDALLEDLDPDDSPELRHVQSSSQSNYPRSSSMSSASDTNTNSRQNQPLRKSTIPLNPTDLTAATERFQQWTNNERVQQMSTSFSSSKDINFGQNSISAEQQQQQRKSGLRIRRPRPGLVESVNKPAPKVKPPGRRRTAVSMQSPAIDDDVLRKIKSSAASTSTTTTPGNNNNNNNSNLNPNSETTSTMVASKPGAVAVAGPPPPLTTKTPEVRSAIVSHILNSSTTGTPNDDLKPLSTQSHHSHGRQPPRYSSPDDTTMNTATSRSFNDSTSINPMNSKNRIDQTMRQQKITESGSESNRTDMLYMRDYERDQFSNSTMKSSPVATSASVPPATAWNNSGLAQTYTTATNYATTHDWPTLHEQREWKPPPSSSSIYPRTSIDRDQNLTEQELRDLERAIRESETAEQSNQTATALRRLSTDDFDLAGASKYLSEEELMNIQEALNDEVDIPTREYEHGDDSVNTSSRSIQKQAHCAPADDADEAEAIARALREADEEEERRSFELAMLMQQEEAIQFKSEKVAGIQQQQHQGNVRLMTREEYAAQQFEQYIPTNSHARSVSMHDNHVDEDIDHIDDDDQLVDGFRMNSSAQHKWSRRDQTSVVGPNQEIRTKHDRILHNEANAHRLGLISENASVGNQAYNSFIQSMKSNSKGVAMKGTGRAGSDADATKGGAMDPSVRQHISRAINNEIIEKCNGVVKEGKEAIIYHADKGAESGGFDVAIKVFKKIQEFRNRYYYVDGDPRYGKTNFRNLSSNEQLVLWTEKEYRNLTRANRAGVPVPIPLFLKENILFMRFLGDDGWPAPQLRELELNHGSRRWSTLFSQIMEAVKLLYQAGHLVHGDLSEYNILVAPSKFVIGPNNTIMKNNGGEDLQIILIDFGQAVDTRHPEATILLQRDLDRILTFFAHQGIDVPAIDEALSIIIG